MIYSLFKMLECCICWTQAGQKNDCNYRQWKCYLTPDYIQNTKTEFSFYCCQFLSCYSKLQQRFPVILHNLSLALTNHPWKGGLCWWGGMNGQSWNWPNNQVVQIWPTAGSREHEQNFSQSNMFVSQIFLAIKCFQCENCFQLYILK